MKKSKNPTTSSNLRQISETSSNIHQHFTTNISEFNYLSPEVWTQILLSLPAKTLLKFRCVCKSWCSIIDDPDFIHMHFQLCKINSGNNQLLLALERLRGNRDEEWLLTVREAETLQNTGLIFRISYLYSFHITSSCNGLLLVIVEQYGPHGYQKDLKLWNPCIRKSLLLPTCPLCLSLVTTQYYLLGFAPDSKDYKVVALAFENSLGIRPTKMHSAVYTLRDQLWTVRNPITTCMIELNSLSKAVFFRGLFEHDNEKGPWTLWFSGKSTPDAYQLFFNGKCYYQKVFYYGSDGGYFVCGNMAYNIASCQVKKFKRSSSHYFQQETYSESLVLSKVYGSRDLRDFP